MPPTIGSSYLLKVVQGVNLNLWDTAGQERFRSLALIYYRSADIVVFVYDITNRQSFDNLEGRISEVKEKALRDVKIIIVGNKTDLQDERQVTTEEGRSFSIEKNASYFCEVSSKSGTNINELFEKIAEISQTNDDDNNLNNEVEIKPKINIENETTKKSVENENQKEQEINYNEKNMKFSILSNNFKGIPFHLYEKNFTFIVNGKRYETNRIIADILSPHLRKSMN